MTNKKRLKDPWIDNGLGVTLFVPRTSRVRMGANPVQETRFSAKCTYRFQPCVELHWSDGHIVTDDEIDEMCVCDAEMLRREYFGEWMKRVIAKVRHLKRTAPGRVPFEWLAIGDRFKYCGSWGTKRTDTQAEQHGIYGLRDFELDDMVWRPEE